MSLRVTCEPCQEPMTVLFQTTVSSDEVVYVMHCTSCGGRVGVQNEKDPKQTFNSIKRVKDGGSLVPATAPQQIQVKREVLGPDELRARIMGE